MTMKQSASVKLLSSTSRTISMTATETQTVWFPSLSEQQKIADCLSSLDELIIAEIQKLDTLKAHKIGLMQQLFPNQAEE